MTRTCSECGGKIGPKNVSGRCNSCYHSMDRRGGIIAMYREGKTCTEIGEALGVGRQAIHGILKRAGELRTSSRDHSGEYHKRAAKIASQRLLAAYQRVFEGKPSLALGGRPTTLSVHIAALDALSRTRALTLDESLELERSIKLEQAECAADAGPHAPSPMTTPWLEDHRCDPLHPPTLAPTPRPLRAPPPSTGRMDKEACVIELPWPPSVLSGHNTGHWGDKHGVIAKHRAWAKAATLAAKIAVPATGDIRVCVTFYPPDQRGDRVNYPNRMKPYWDGVADALQVNDRRFLPNFQFAEPVKGGGRVVVVIG